MACYRENFTFYLFSRCIRAYVLELPIHSAHVTKLRTVHVLAHTFDVIISSAAITTVWHVRT